MLCETPGNVGRDFAIFAYQRAGFQLIGATGPHLLITSIVDIALREVTACEP